MPPLANGPRVKGLTVLLLKQVTINFYRAWPGRSSLRWQYKQDMPSLVQNT